MRHGKITHMKPVYKETMHNHINDITNDIINRRSNMLYVHCTRTYYIRQECPTSYGMHF